MARTGKWPARIALALSAAMIAALLTVMTASGQQPSGAGLPTIGIDVQSATLTQATYSLVVRNQGNAPSTNVVVRSAVPANATFESSEPAPGATTSPGSGAQSCANAGVREAEGTTCQWNLGTIPAGETRTITAIYNLNQTNIATYRVALSGNVRDDEGHTNADTDDSLVRQRGSINDDTWVNDNEPANTNHGACNFLRVLQDNSVTSYADADTLLTIPAATDNSTNSLESFYGAQLRFEVLDTTYSSLTPGSIGVHRIVSGEWVQGAGTCPGAAGEGDQPRTGFEPLAAAAPTSTTTIDGAPAIANWDVTADLDSEGDRGSFQGWELRDATSTPGDNSTRFHSVESGGTATEQDPRIFLVYTTAEEATCLDNDPETATAAVGSEHVMTVFVTDGEKTPTGTAPGSTTGPGGDACNGAPVATPVVWEIQDDTPDIYFSSQEGSPIAKTITNSNASPNSIETTADANGLTNAGVRLNAAPSTSDTTNVIEARIKGAEDPDPNPAPTPPVGVCDPEPIPPDNNCTGESEAVDDVSVTWGTQSGQSGASSSTTTSSPTGGSSTSPSPSGSSSASPSPSGSGSTSPSPSGSASSTSPTAPPSSPSSSSSPQQSSRTISLFASTNEVVYPGEVTLSGQILSADSSCDDAGEFVRLQRRIFGESEYSDAESMNTDADGRYSFTVPATESAEYVALAPRHDQCADATSASETVLVKVKVTAASGRRAVDRGAKVGIVGRVQPKHAGTKVFLQRKKGNGFKTVARDNLNGRSRYRFVLKAKWNGRRVFRVMWRSQDEDHATNNSRNVAVRVRRR